VAKSPIDIAESLARPSAATIFELRGEWRRLHRAPPPMRLSRDLSMRGITYKLQERPLGGLSKSIIRKLERLTETCYEKSKHYRKFEGAESALEWEEMEELLRRIREILREGMPPSL
jgi:DUF2924 family protein